MPAVVVFQCYKNDICGIKSNRVIDVTLCTLDWYTPHEVYSGKLAKFEDPTQILQ